MLGLDLHNDLGYLSNDGDTEELFKCLDPIDPKIVIYVEHATPVQKKIVNSYINVVDSSEFRSIESNFRLIEPSRFTQ